MKRGLVAGGSLGKPGLVRGGLGAFGQTAADVRCGGAVDGSVAVVAAEDGRDGLTHEVDAEADDGLGVGVLAHGHGVVSHFERVGDGYERCGGDAWDALAVELHLAVADGVEDALQLDVHVVVRHYADVEGEEAVEELFDDVGGGLQEGGLGLGEGAHGRQVAVGSDEQRGEGGDLLGGRCGGDAGGGEASGGIRAGEQCCTDEIVVANW